MAAFTVAEVCQQARTVYLNDTSVGEIFSDAVLLPYVIRAFEELNAKLARIGHQVTESALGLGQVLLGNKTLDAPVDLLEPISLEERQLGSTSENDWREMTRERNLSSGPPQASLGVWDWNQNRFVFRGAESDVEIRIRYIRFLPALTVGTDQPIVLGSKPFLSARTAALAAGHIGANPDKAAYIQLDADSAVDDLIGISVNGEQATPVRRRPFRR